MGDNYIPPDSTNIPFNFTERGYESPNSTELLLNFAPPANFGTLKSAINVMQPYWYETHTYTKSCPKYVIGYGPSAIQIIRGKCLYGGIRDLRGFVRCNVRESRDLHAEIFAGPALYSEYLRGILSGWQIINMGATIDTHLPVDLKGIIKGFGEGSSTLPSNIYGWIERDLGMTLAGTHDPVDLHARMRVTQREESLLNAIIHSWHIGDLSAFIIGSVGFDLPSTISPIPPGLLPAYLKVYPQKYLPASTYGWGALDLGAYVNQIWSHDLSASVVGLDDNFKNLRARLRGVGSGYKDLGAYIRSFHWEGLGGSVVATYFSDINAYLFAVAPKDLIGVIRGWDVRYLQGIITGQNYPWNLTAEIYPGGQWFTLSASLFSKQGIANYGNLRMIIHPWERRDFPAYIKGAIAPVLFAYLNPLGYASDLHASLRPKMIRLTTVIDIPTLAHKDLSAIINFPCRKTGYSYLSSFLYAKWKGDLSAYIRIMRFNYKPSMLGAKTGYTDSYLEVDKLKLCINVYPGEFFTQDRFKVILNVLDSKNILSAYIRGTLRFGSISASVTAEEIPSYTFTKAPVNREMVIHKTYDGILRKFETVEMAFKSAVRDYYYSSDGDFAWKEDRLNKWILSVKSILPANTLLKLRRRLHRSTTIHDLKKYSSVDDAVKAAITYVTAYPQASLSASIVNKGTFSGLFGTISPRYTRSSDTGLGSSVISVGSTVVVGEESSISKI